MQIELASCKEELFIKNVKIGELKEIEEVAEVAVDRCRNHLISLQRRVEKRKYMLGEVRDKLADVEDDTINEECENIMKSIETRNMEGGKVLSDFKTNMKSLDIKRKNLQDNLGGKMLRIQLVNERLDDDKRQIVKLTDKINTIL